MASVDELIARYQDDPEMQAEARKVLRDGKLSMKDALRLYRKYRPEVPPEKLMHYWRNLPVYMEKARRRGIIKCTDR